MKLTEKVDSTLERVLLFGGPKSGKTALTANLAEQFNIHLFDLENGYKTLRKLPAEWQERVNVYSLPDTRIYPIAIETMLKVVTGLPVDFCIEHAKVNCMICKKDSKPMEHVELNALGQNDIVIFDSLTQLANSAMAHVKKNDDELSKPEWTDFMKQGFLMDKFLSQCQHAKYNLVAITHEVEAELENGGKKLVPVAGTREFSRNTAKYFDHVVYCELKNKKHTFGSATNYALSVLTGSRSDVAIEGMDTASLLPFFRHEIPKQEKQNDTRPVRQTVVGTAPARQDDTKAAEEAIATNLIPLNPTVAIPSASLAKQETMTEKLARMKAERAAAKG